MPQTKFPTDKSTKADIEKDPSGDEASSPSGSLMFLGFRGADLSELEKLTWFQKTQERWIQTVYGSRGLNYFGQPKHPWKQRVRQARVYFEVCIKVPDAIPVTSSDSPRMKSLGACFFSPMKESGSVARSTPACNTSKWQWTQAITKLQRRSLPLPLTWAHPEMTPTSFEDMKKRFSMVENAALTNPADTMLWSVVDSITNP